MLKYIFYLIILIIIIYYFDFMTQYNTKNKKERKNKKETQFKIYNSRKEKKSALSVNHEIINIVDNANNNKYELTNITKQEYNYFLAEYNDKKRTYYALKCEISQWNFAKVKIVLNNILTKLNLIEKNMYIASNNNTKTSCEVLDKKTFLEAFELICNIIFIFNNTIDNYHYSQIIPYYELLYDKYVLLYRYINKHKVIKIGGIETIFVSSHHQACEWIYKKYTSDILPTILHVDSHPDTNPFSDPKKLLKIKNDPHNIDNISDLYTNILNNDIGCLLIPVIYPYKHNDGFFWLIPKWVPMPKNPEQCAKVVESEIYLDDEQVNWSWSDICIDEFNEEEILKTNRNVKTNVDYIENAHNYIDKIQDKYILNIDIDYFVTIGEENVKIDNTSHHRTNIDVTRIKKDKLYFIKKNKELNIELNIIKHRIDDFLVFIKKLKDFNKTPGFIILCNSSQHNVNLFKEPWFDIDSDLDIYNILDEKNEYTPKYLYIWLQHTLLMHLKSIFE